MIKTNNNTKNTPPKSCYIHIPFCKNICSYCDFCKIYYNENYINSYLEALKNEITTTYKKETLKTIYIGGGTPSSLKKDELEKLFKITNILKTEKNYEFTFECNIENITKDLLILLKENKVNRLSIGIESFNKYVLKILGRKYDPLVKKKIELAKKYFDNINIDIIYGVNGETLTDLKNDIKKFIELDIPHISLYSLILENNTLLKIQNYKEIDEDLNRKMYDYLCETLKKHGYIHYEISNFTKPNYASKHNLTYWNNEKYYGFGLGASGYINNIRYTNTRNIKKYLNNNYIYIKEVIDKQIDMENFMILGLRKLDGVSNKSFYDKYSKNINEVFDTHKLGFKKGNYYIKENDLYISNQILCDFININS